MIKKPELLAPAGNFEKLEIAIHYGADAVYLSGKDFSLRNFSGNFDDDQIAAGIELAHSHQVKVYLACNIYARNHEQPLLEKYLEKIGAIQPDAIIVSDPGIIFLARKIIPHVDIHLSTQANTTNYNTLEFWKQAGIKRVNLARELSLDEIKEITSRSILETEIFIHGAMCVSYSGRCLLSSFLTNRDSNRGLCSHPCRWKYAVVEEQRPGEYHPLLEDERGSYIFSSKDLCMIDHIPELVESGVTSFKIEGRMKGINYLASTVKTYRQAIDSYYQSPKSFRTDPGWHDELNQIYNRTFCTGFFFSNPDDQTCNWSNRHSGKIHSFIGKIISGCDNCSETHRVEIRNKVSCRDIVEIISPGKPNRKSRILHIRNSSGESIDHAQPNTVADIKLEAACHPNDILRKR